MYHTPLREGIDYYMDNGLMVLTERYLRQRGYCCLTGCRHCPWGNSLPSPPTSWANTPPPNPPPQS